jgi:hypothetical protein
LVRALKACRVKWISGVSEHPKNKRDIEQRSTQFDRIMRQRKIVVNPLLVDRDMR